MMEYPVIWKGEQIGHVQLIEQGLYWQLVCTCQPLSDRVERLYAGQRRLGVLEREGERLVCRRRLSRASTPELPPPGGVFTLEPTAELRPWQGLLAGISLTGFQDAEKLLFPYAPDRPCPCEPLICFFKVQNGFWTLPKRWAGIETDT